MFSIAHADCVLNVSYLKDNNFPESFLNPCFFHSSEYIVYVMLLGEFTWQKITTDLMRPELEHLRSRYKRLISMFYVERKSGRGGAAGLLQVTESTAKEKKHIQN